MFWCSAYNVFEICAHNSVVIPVLLLIFIVVQSEENFFFYFQMIVASTLEEVGKPVSRSRKRRV